MPTTYFGNLLNTADLRGDLYVVMLIRHLFKLAELP